MIQSGPPHNTGRRLHWRRLPDWSPSGRATCLAAALSVCALAFTIDFDWKPAAPAPIHLAWWLLIPAFVLSNICVLHLEVREEAHTFTLSELPLIVGLFFVSPAALIAGRLVGEAVYFGAIRRQAPLKLFFNLSMFWAETAVAVAVFRYMHGGHNPLHAASWLPVALAVGAADLIGTTAVAQAIRWHGGDFSTTSVLRTSGVTAVVNVTLALLAVIVLWVAPVAMLLFVVIAGVTGLAYRSYARLRQRHTSLQMLYDFTRAVGASMQAEEVMAEVLAEARRLLRAGVAEVVLFDTETGRTMFRQRNSEADGPTFLDAEREAATEGLWQQVLEDGKALVLRRSGRSETVRAALADLGVRDAIIAPVRSDDMVIGSIMVGNRLGQVSSFDDQDARLFETLANHASVAFENGRLVERLRREAAERRHEALHDALTGLANRRLFTQKVEEIRQPAETETGWAVMLMDLDRFKEVNDTLGHHNGDLMLCEVAARLVATVGPHDTVARLGGDEFAVLLPELTTPRQAEVVAGQIIEALNRSFPL
jgi:GGDEF domain-containing protein